MNWSFEKILTLLSVLAFLGFIVVPSLILPFIWAGSIIKSIYLRIKGYFKHQQFKVQYTYDDKEGSSFKVPLIFYTFSFIPIIFFTLFFVMFFGEISSYLLANILYFVLLFVAIRLYYGKDNNHASVNSVLESHLAYLQASFIPISFLAGFSGFILSLTGIITELKDITFSVNELGTLVTSAFSKYDFSSNPSLATLVFFILVIAIVSLPTQFIAYLALRIYKYSIKYGSPYWIFAKKVAKKLTK